MQYICKINSTLGLQGRVVTIDNAERARALLANGVIEPRPDTTAESEPEQPRKRRKRKGGATPEDAGQDAERAVAGGYETSEDD